MVSFDTILFFHDQLSATRMAHARDYVNLSRRASDPAQESLPPRQPIR